MYYAKARREWEALFRLPCLRFRRKQQPRATRRTRRVQCGAMNENRLLRSESSS